MNSQTDQEKYPELFVPDKDVNPRTRIRTVPMRILHMSMPRTGTSSMEEAFKILGYGPVCHGFNMHVHVQDVKMWGELLNIKYFFSKPATEQLPFGRQGFDNLLGDYEVVSDFPPLAFAHELIAAYPEAKVIIVEWDVEAWYKSFNSTFIRNNFHPMTGLVCSLDYKLGAFAKVTMLYVEGWFKANSAKELQTNVRSVYREHYELMRRVTPKDRLLDFKLSDGWELLCAFLEKDILDVPFPRVNEAEEFQRKSNIMVSIAAKRALKKAAPILGVVGVGVLSIFWYMW